MAEIIPFKSWHYKNFHKIRQRTASLSETKPIQIQKKFYQIPYHNFLISSPEDVPPFSKVKTRLEHWKEKNILEQDQIPAFYAYYQEYYLKNSPDKIRLRKGIIALIKICDWEEKIILPHEKTIQKAINYRLELLKNTGLHTVPTHGIYEDNQFQIEKYTNDALKKSLFRVKDSDGVLHSFAPIQDLKIIKAIQEIIKNKQIFIADGHHRYESSLTFARWKRKQSNTNEKLPSDYHLMYLSNALPEEDGILPTHRILQNIPNFSEENFIKKLKVYFEIEPLSNAKILLEKPYEKAWAFGLIFSEKSFYIKLKQEAWDIFEKDWKEPEVIKNLDIAVMQHFIFEKVLDLKGQEVFEYLDYEQYSSDCLKRIETREGQLAILTHKIPFNEIKEVCLAGKTMPAKSTYFFPKVLSGVYFASIKENEFFSPVIPFL